MKKRIVLMLAAICCLACEKTKNDFAGEENLPEETLFTLSETDLAGTCWARSREVYTGYQYGHYISVDTSVRAPEGLAGLIICFGEDGKLTEYIDPDVPGPFFRTHGYTCDETLHEVAFDGMRYRLIRLTPEELVWTYEENTEQEQMIHTDYFRQFEPSEAWLQEINNCADRTEAN